MARRKTYALKQIVEKANAFLAVTRGYADTAEDKAARKAVRYFVADLLLDSDTYSGFGYLQPYAPEDPAFDESRIVFYAPKL